MSQHQTVKKNEPRKFKLYFQKGDCRMALFDNLIYPIAESRKFMLEHKYHDWKGKFVISY